MFKNLLYNYIMKLNGGKISKGSEFPKKQIKTSSQDLNNSSSHSNFYVSKIMKQNKIKNESLINESLPNLKNNIQNIFSNEDKKEKIFQFLIKKNKDRSANISRDLKKSLKTPEIKPIKKFQPKRVISPYDINEYYSIKPPKNDSDMARSCIDIRGINNIGDNNKNMSYRYSVISRFNPDDEPMNQNEFYKGNKFYQNNNNTYSNLITNNNNFNINTNRDNKYEHIEIYNTYNNTFNNCRMRKNRVIDSHNDHTYDYNNSSNLRKTINKTEKNSLEKNPYKDYMRNSNLYDIKKKILDNSKKNIIDNSDDEEDNKEKNIENNDDNLNNIKNYYLRRVKNEKNKVNKKDNLNTKKQLPLTINDSYTNNKNNYYYVHKNFRNKKFNQKKFNDLNSYSYNNNITYDNNKPYEKRKNNNDIYGPRYIRVNTLDNNKKNNTDSKKYEKENKVNDNDNNNNDPSKMSKIKVNIDKSLNKNFYNSPLTSLRFYNFFNNNNFDNKNINNNNINNKKIYEKRDPYQRSSNSKVIDTKIGNDNNDIPIKDNKIPYPEKNNMNNKYIFNDEDEIIEFIKKKYNKRNVDEIVNREKNNTPYDELKKEKKEKYKGIMTTEEGDLIKLKNEELSNEIKQLKFENNQYKKELNDMKNKFNNLNKKVDTIQENK